MCALRIASLLVAAWAFASAIPFENHVASLATVDAIEVVQTAGQIDDVDQAVGLAGKVFYEVPIMSPYPIPYENVRPNGRCTNARRSFKKWALNTGFSCVFYSARDCRGMATPNFGGPARGTNTMALSYKCRRSRR